MDPQKLQQLQARFGENVRIGGKGTPRRKRKTVHKTTGGDDKKLQAALKKLGVQPIPAIDEVSIFFQDGRVTQIKNPKVQALIASNMFAVSGVAEQKSVNDMFDPDMLNKLQPEQLAMLKQYLAQNAQLGGGDAAAAAGQDDDIPELVENFEAAANSAEPAEAK